MASTEAHATITGNISDTTTADVPHTPTTNIQGGSIPPLGEAQTQASGSQESYVPSTEHDRPSPTAAKPIDRLLPVSESLGRSGLLGIVGGSLCILGIFGFLTFLWFGHGSEPEAANATGLWRFIALRNYFPQTITLCALALRLAVSFQAAICTSMVAAIVLERHGAQKTQVAWLSVMRSINDGLLKLCTLLATSKSIAASLRHMEIWVAFLMLVVTSALQFSSTLLLSDINDFTIVGDLNSTQLNDILLFDAANFSIAGVGFSFIIKPPIYAVFGEAQASFNATPSADGVSDTGLIQRSLLPIPESDARSLVRRIDATSMVITSQSACIRPQISAKYSADTLHGNYSGYIVGTIDYKRTLQGAGIGQSSPICRDTGCEDAAFECIIPGAIEGWQTVVCLFDSILGIVGIGGANSEPAWDPADGVWSQNTTIVLVMVSNIDIDGWSMINASTLPAGKPYQEWQSYEIDTGRFINISLCSSGFSLGRFDTSMSTPGPLHELKTNLDLVSKTSSTADIQTFMGVNEPQRSHFDRNILDLKIIGTPAGDNSTSLASQPTNLTYAGVNVTVGRLTTAIIEQAIYYQFAGDQNSSILLCYYCYGYGYSASPELSLLFNDIITETGRPANALLSLTTILFTIVYYSYLNSFLVLQDANLIATTIVPAPGPCVINGCPGYVSVTALLFVHLLCVAVITIVYVWQTRYSRHGNIWHTISQLTGDGLADMLREAQHANDAKIERMVNKGNKNYRVKVGRQQAKGPIEVIKF